MPEKRVKGNPYGYGSNAALLLASLNIYCFLSGMYGEDFLLTPRFVLKIAAAVCLQDIKSS